jgi:ribosomal-protein-serine acetyltransferase
VLKVEVSKSIHLQILDLSHAKELFDLVNKNREHLKLFLPWLDKNTHLDHTKSFIRFNLDNLTKTKTPMYGIFVECALVGMAGFHTIDKDNAKSSIGYWLDQDLCGRGIITSCVRVLVEIGFKTLQLQRIEIRCATENIASQQIPKKLGFTSEGVLRANEHLYGRYVDHQVYSMIRGEKVL